MSGRAEMEGVVEDTVGDDCNAAFDTPFHNHSSRLHGRSERNKVDCYHRDWSWNLKSHVFPNSFSVSIRKPEIRGTAFAK